MTTPTQPAATAAIQDRVDAVLADFLDNRADQWRASWGGDAVTGLVRSFTLDGGKRLRPRLCYWGWRGVGEEDGDPIIRAAASLELFHAFCLVHDDLMDNSDTRRGQPTMHRALAGREGENPRAQRHGTGVALLVGDLLLLWADRLWHTSGLDLARLERARAVWQWMREEAIAGQYLDVRQQMHGAEYEQALQVAHLKSAQYSVHRPLQLGGLLAGASSDLLQSYTSFGVPLGEAFQLRDDVLGAFGDPEVTGKSAVDDFREGKPTVLIALARSQASSRQLAELDRLHGKSDLDTTGVDTLRTILQDTGALTSVEALIEQRTHTALDALYDGPATTETRDELRELAVAATNRTV